MPYFNNVPQANQRVSSSQNPILVNFEEIATAFNRNHFTIGTADSGKHNRTQFVRLAATPGAFALNEIGLFNLNYATTGQSELYYRNAAAAEWPITARSLYNPPAVAPAAPNNWFYLPCGLVVKMGQRRMDGGTIITIPLNAIGPVFTNIPFVYATPGGQVDGPAAVRIHLNIYDVAAALFRVQIFEAGGNVPFTWLAIGPV